MATYRMNEPAVASETIDGEVVVVNLESGTYYSLRDEAAFLWSLLERGVDSEAMAAEARGAYREDGVAVEPAVARFLEALEGEGLVVPGAPAASAEAAGEVRPVAGAVFREPGFQKYADMQDLLLLDPIHEVDDTGWPNVKPGA